MQVIKFLQEHGLQKLCDIYHIDAKRHGKYPNLVLLKYSQIDSPMGESIVQECRGLILDENNNWQVVSFPYRKFFNHEEGHAAKIDWSTAKVLEKLDGSLMVLWWYLGEWHVSSSGSPDASGLVNNNSSMTFKDLFWKTWNDLGYVHLESYLKDFCFIFELMTPENRVIVPHSKPRIVLHGIRNIRNEGYLEIDPHIGMDNLKQNKSSFNWEVVKEYPFGTFEDVLKATIELNPMKNEGFVLCDENFNRVKVKSPQYVALAHMKDGFSDRRMIELVRTNESSEFLHYFPEYEPLYRNYFDKFNSLVKTLEETYERIKDITIQKEFALEAVKVPGSSTLFNLRTKKIPIRQSLMDMSITALEKIL